MYGMVNRALEHMIKAGFGEDAWEKVKEEAGVDIEVFVSNSGYPDDVTYKLVKACSQILRMTQEQVLFEFGRHWILKTAPDGYGELLNAGGRTLPEFLQNLPNFHSRISLLFPHLQPPRFSCSEATDRSVRLCYRSNRAGLAPFLMGLLDGLGEMFHSPVRVHQEVFRGAQFDYDVFKVEWNGPSK